MVAPARPQVPGSPTLLPQRPAHAPGPLFGVSAASALGPRLPAEGRRAGQDPWAAAWGAEASATRGRSAASAPPGPAQGGPSGGGGPPTVLTPHHPVSQGALTQRVVLLEHPLHGGGWEGMQPGSRSRGAQRTNHNNNDGSGGGGGGDYTTGGTSGCRRLATGRGGASGAFHWAARRGAGPRVKGRSRRRLQEGLQRRSGDDDVHYRAVFEGFGDWEGDVVGSW